MRRQKKSIFYLYKDEPKIKELLKKLKKMRKFYLQKSQDYLLDNFAEYFDSTEIPSILFQVRKRHTNYKEINAHRFDRR